MFLNKTSGPLLPGSIFYHTGASGGLTNNTIMLSEHHGSNHTSTGI